MRQKKVISIQDISCFGKCSQTVSLPILSSAGVETVMLPTALLSTHTGGIDGWTFLDLKDQLIPITDHWKSLGLTFDGIITGYVGSLEMIELVEGIEDKLKDGNTIILSDPAMADNGKMYTLFDEAYAKRMKELCDKADIVLPNITEACFMTGEEYKEGPYTKDYIEHLLKRLCEGGPKVSILTGVYFEKDHLGAAVYDKEKETIDYAFNSRIEGYYHGTGDIFANAYFGAYMMGKSHAEAIQIAVDFTHDSIKRTLEAKTDIRFGVNFEAGLGEYAKKING